MTQQLVQKLDAAKLATVTANLEPAHRRRLEEMPVHNASVIIDNILDETTTGNIKDSSKGLKLFILCQFSKALHHKPFHDMGREDVLTFLNSARKSEQEDSTHKWIGNYNSRVRILTKFFKWLFNPNQHDPKQRKMPKLLDGIIQLPRKEKSKYKPEDMLTAEEQAVFLKYCPSKRDRAYVALDLDTSARPHEILKQNIGDIKFKMSTTGIQYSEITVSGKTGTRSLPVIDSVPYLREWIAVHPMGSNPNAPLFISESDMNRGARLHVDSLWRAITRHKMHLEQLLSNEDLPHEDKETIKTLVQKPFSPYVLRHTSLTAMAQIIPEMNLKHHAGWSSTSNMPKVYLHFLGGESCKAIFEAKGVTIKDAKTINPLQARYCPQCKEANTQTAKFCFKCKMVLTFDGYTEAVAAQEQIKAELELVKKQQTAAAELLDDILHQEPNKMKEFLEWMQKARDYNREHGGHPF